MTIRWLEDYDNINLHVRRKVYWDGKIMCIDMRIFNTKRVKDAERK